MLDYAKSEGKQNLLAENLFKIYFEQGKNINSTDVLAQVAVDTGLNIDAMEKWVSLSIILPLSYIQKIIWNMILILNLSMLISLGMSCFVIIYLTSCCIYFLRCYHTSYVHITTSLCIGHLFSQCNNNFSLVNGLNQGVICDSGVW